MNYRLNLLLPILLAAFSFSSVIAQKTSAGYVVTNEYDTIRGLIKDKDWNRNPTQITIANESGTRKFKPNQILQFRTEKGNLYQSKLINKSDTVFLEVLVSSSVSLYSYKSISDMELFYSSGADLIKLEYQEVMVEGGKAIKKIETYKDQLRRVFTSCISDKRIKTLSFRKEDLRKIFLEHAVCTNGSTEFVAKKEKVKTELYLLGGVTYTSVDFTSDDVTQTFNFKSLLDSEFPSSVDPTGGIGFNFILPKSNNKQAIVVELIYTGYSTKQSLYGFENSFDLKYLKLNTAFQYSFLTTGVKPFVHIGISNAYAVKYDIESVDFSRKYDQGIFGGIGAGYKRLSIISRYEFSRGVSDYYEIKSPTSSIYFIVSYRLNK